MNKNKILMMVSGAFLFSLFILWQTNPTIATSSWDRRMQAKQYSDDWALSYNPNYKQFDSDCQNFVSQALHEGGEYPMQDNDPKWYMHKHWWGWTWSHSWTVVDDFRNMLYDRGWGEWWGYQAYQSTNNAWYGDAIGYKWDGQGSWDHISMEAVYYGTDPDSGWIGDLVNAHNSSRWHAIWHLAPYNADWQTTTYGSWHIKYQ